MKPKWKNNFNKKKWDLKQNDQLSLFTIFISIGAALLICSSVKCWNINRIDDQVNDNDLRFDHHLIDETMDYELEIVKNPINQIRVKRDIESTENSNLWSLTIGLFIFKNILLGVFIWCIWRAMIYNRLKRINATTGKSYLLTTNNPTQPKKSPDKLKSPEKLKTPPRSLTPLQGKSSPKSSPKSTPKSLPKSVPKHSSPKK